MHRVADMQTYNICEMTNTHTHTQTHTHTHTHTGHAEHCLTQTKDRSRYTETQIDRQSHTLHVRTSRQTEIRNSVRQPQETQISSHGMELEIILTERTDIDYAACQSTGVNR